MYYGHPRPNPKAAHFDPAKPSVVPNEPFSKKSLKCTTDLFDLRKHVKHSASNFSFIQPKESPLRISSKNKPHNSPTAKIVDTAIKGLYARKGLTRSKNLDASRIARFSPHAPPESDGESDPSEDESTPHESDELMPGPSDDTLRRTVLSDNQMESSSLDSMHDRSNVSTDDADYCTPLREGEERETYMYNIKTGSMIPSTYMVEILPEPKPQAKGRYDPK